MISWLRPLILGFALSIVGLRILGFEFFAAHVESISLGGVAVVGPASLGFRALMRICGIGSRRALNLGPAGFRARTPPALVLDRFVRVLASIAFVVAAYAAFVVVVRVGRADPTAVDVGVVGGHRFTLVDLARFVIAVLATIVAAAWVRKGLELFLLPLTKMDLGTRYAVAVASSYGVLAVGSVVSLTQLGLALGDFAILLGAAGFGIGLGLQETASNFMNGLILLFSRPVKVGDVIESEGRTGTIADISISSTLLITPENHEIRIPNREIIGKRLVNYTGRDPKVRGTCKVGIGYGSDLDKARRILIEVASKTPGSSPPGDAGRSPRIRRELGRPRVEVLGPGRSARRHRVASALAALPALHGGRHRGPIPTAGDSGEGADRDSARLTDPTRGSRLGESRPPMLRPLPHL